MARGRGIVVGVPEQIKTLNETKVLGSTLSQQPLVYKCQLKFTDPRPTVMMGPEMKVILPLAQKDQYNASSSVLIVAHRSPL